MHDAQQRNVLVGQQPLEPQLAEADGKYVELDGEEFYRIGNYDRMSPFFMSLVSGSEHWLFISSTGGLTAGRRQAEVALFPYTTEDKIAESHETTGSKTTILLEKDDNLVLWEPFSARYSGIYQTTRNLYKNISGSKLFFEEINHDLGLSFRYGWMSSPEFGFVRKTTIRNISSASATVRCLDGIQNLMPYGVTERMQNELSCLVDAYKRNELDVETGLGIYTLSSILTDKAEPSEALKATTVWSIGEDIVPTLVSSSQLECFSRGESLERETDTRARRGAYFVSLEKELLEGEESEWFLAADVYQDHNDIAVLRNKLNQPQKLKCELLEDIELGCERLTQIVADADGIQLSADSLTANHHFANTMFNVMRGGIPAKGYTISKEDLLSFIENRNCDVLAETIACLKSIPPEANIETIMELATNAENPNISRLVMEYLPLTFSRRHGDPSRPWNRFSIQLEDEKGQPILNYQGNWRDIFQNWEALALSYPKYLDNMIAKFVNATTVDGNNPYRVTRDGIDWEEPEPDNPWANIGYWGDHQIIYLLKLLEWHQRFYPGKLNSYLEKPIFSYADVPYEIKNYEDIIKDSRDTIVFNFEHNDMIHARVQDKGTDGKLLHDGEGNIVHVNLLEKLVVPMLAKLSNLVPGGGIWMNTQRPEWNDGNNALAGPGLSMVTLSYLYRYIDFLLDLISKANPAKEYELSQNVTEWLQGTGTVLASVQDPTQLCTDPSQRQKFLDSAGKVASQYRNHVYRQGIGEAKGTLSNGQLTVFLNNAKTILKASITCNQREDGLYHSYNLLRLRSGSAEVSHLPEMLEGQVAVLSSGALSPDEGLSVLRVLRNSRMYRRDQHSYTLYPDRDLPGFLQKNQVSEDAVQSSRLFRTLLEREDESLISRDLDGTCHFNGTFTNSASLEPVLQELAQDQTIADVVRQEHDQIKELFEDTFNHHAFTGRSGTFFAYEGLGSIYWHMVSKLLLAAQELCLRAETGSDTFRRLVEAYYDIRSGLGFNKSPDDYGAFPTDPYSHTPAHKGAQQPGMTGQVKEELITRIGELGITIEGGSIKITPCLLHQQEFLIEPGHFKYRDLTGKTKAMALAHEEMAFTFCGIPFIYQLTSNCEKIVVTCNGKDETYDGLTLPPNVSTSIFNRQQTVKCVTVHCNSQSILTASR